jgi:hypothetical protein
MLRVKARQFAPSLGKIRLQFDRAIERLESVRIPALRIERPAELELARRP